ncbi:peptidylprolyl isomerase [Saccharibacillus sp. O23]|uniref:stalk domain-containing protein n=1 Tax=Saccharibacillus sp. O23 TaxID=2009338 RepID=UPI000B4E0676|nr:stalk domain-containing protein [Saccharibacillus sp. O23]OWR30781.1 peptidylprolyl isomerase [Saccharibacillus sp. O23]
MKKRISFLSIFTLCLLLSSFAAFSSSARAETDDRPIMLKINQYYIVYTSSGSPYLDNKGSMMLPLRAVSELTGAAVSYNKGTKQTTMKWKDRTVTFKPNSQTVLYNQNPKTLKSAAVIQNGHLFVPARVLLDGLKIDGSYQNALLTLKDKNFKTSSKLIAYLETSGIDFNQTPKAANMQTNEIRPLSVSLNLPTVGKGKGSMTLTARNISGAAIAAGKEDLHTTIATGKPASDGIYNFQFQNPNRLRAAIAKDATFTFKSDIDLSAGPLQYILAVGSTLD